MNDLFDALKPAVHADPRPTEVLAAATVAPHLGRLAGIVLALVRAAGMYGVTGDQICETRPDLNPYSLRPRLTQLSRLGLIVATMARPNRRGNSETVWVDRATWEWGGP